MFKKPVVICIGGPPASGKEVHGKMLMDFVYENSLSSAKVLQFDNGVSLRDAVKNNTFTKYMRNILDESINNQGETVPGAITIGNIIDFIFKTNEGNTSYILKGVFRTPHEPSLFTEFANKYLSEHLLFFVRLNVSDETIRQRIFTKDRPNRKDDQNIETVKNRIKNYRKYTNIIYDKIKKSESFYFIEVEGGEESPKNIFEYIISQLNWLMIMEDVI